MTYDWDGRRNRLMRAARITAGAALTIAILSLPLLIFAWCVRRIVASSSITGRFGRDERAFNNRRLRIQLMTQAGVFSFERGNFGVLGVMGQASVFYLLSQ